MQMSFYRKKVCPYLTRLAMSTDRLRPYRETVAGPASVLILEIGIGSGSILGHYRHTAESLTGIDPSEAMLPRTANVDSNAA